MMKLIAQLLTAVALSHFIWVANAQNPAPSCRAILEVKEILETQETAKTIPHQIVVSPVEGNCAGLKLGAAYATGNINYSPDVDGATIAALFHPGSRIRGELSPGTTASADGKHTIQWLQFSYPATSQRDIGFTIATDVK